MAPAFSKRPGQQIATREDGLSYALSTGEPPRVMSLNENQRHEFRCDGAVDSLKVAGGKPGQGYAAAFDGSAVRRLTPLECERLQGFPDGWTEGESDSTRYRMLGNAVCVPVAEWLGKRLLEQHGQAD